jgi:hypothetical protein
MVNPFGPAAFSGHASMNDSFNFVPDATSENDDMTWASGQESSQASGQINKALPDYLKVVKPKTSRIDDDDQSWFSEASDAESISSRRSQQQKKKKKRVRRKRAKSAEDATSNAPRSPIMVEDVTLLARHPAEESDLEDSFFHFSANFDAFESSIEMNNGQSSTNQSGSGLNQSSTEQNSSLNQSSLHQSSLNQSSLHQSSLNQSSNFNQSSNLNQSSANQNSINYSSSDLNNQTQPPGSAKNGRSTSSLGMAAFGQERSSSSWGVAAFEQDRSHSSLALAAFGYHPPPSTFEASGSNFEKSFELLSVSSHAQSPEQTARKTAMGRESEVLFPATAFGIPPSPRSSSIASGQNSPKPSSPTSPRRSPISPRKAATISMKPYSPNGVAKPSASTKNAAAKMSPKKKKPALFSSVKAFGNSSTPAFFNLNGHNLAESQRPHIQRSNSSASLKKNKRPVQPVAAMLKEDWAEFGQKGVPPQQQRRNMKAAAAAMAKPSTSLLGPSEHSAASDGPKVGGRRYLNASSTKSKTYQNMDPMSSSDHGPRRGRVGKQNSFSRRVPVVQGVATDQVSVNSAENKIGRGRQSSRGEGEVRSSSRSRSRIRTRRETGAVDNMAKSRSLLGASGGNISGPTTKHPTRSKGKATSKIGTPALKDLSQVTAIKKNLVKVRDEIVGKSRMGPGSILLNSKMPSSIVPKQRGPTNTEKGPQQANNEKWMAVVHNEIKGASKAGSGGAILKSKAPPDASKRPVLKTGQPRLKESAKPRLIKKTVQPPPVERHGVARAKKGNISSTQSKLCKRKPRVSPAGFEEANSSDEKVARLHPEQGRAITSDQQVKKHRRKKSGGSAGVATPGGGEVKMLPTRKPRRASDNAALSDDLPRKPSSNTLLSADVPTRRPGTKTSGSRSLKSAAVKGSPVPRRKSDAIPVARTKKLVHRRQSPPSSNVKLLVDGHHGHLAEAK